MRRIGPPVADLPDEVLLAGLCSGDEELTAAFVQRFQAKVHGVAMAVTADAGTAEDIAQQAFERAWRHGRTYDPRRGPVATWLSAITRNLAIDANRIRRPAPVDAADLVARVVAGDTPEAGALAGETAGELIAALRCLPAEQARAVVLAGIGGLSASEVARREGIPLGTAKTRIRTALHRLRAVLVDAGAGNG
ncbi:MAG: RNA polymerase sigma factor [Acidimicrobiales bacterium]